MTNDRNYRRSIDALRSARPPRLVPAPVVAEAYYLLAPEPERMSRRRPSGHFPPASSPVADLIAEDLARAPDLPPRPAGPITADDLH